MEKKLGHVQAILSAFFSSYYCISLFIPAIVQEPVTRTDVLLTSILFAVLSMKSKLPNVPVKD